MNNYIKPVWPVLGNIKSFTTTRIGGCSKEPYDELNLGDHVGDNLDFVLSNRKKLMEDLMLPQEPIWLKQTHSTKVVCLDTLETPCLSQIEADASYTTKPNVVCAVLTADCLPVLLSSKDGSLVAAIHAGWKGLASGIIEETLDVIGIDAKNILVWLGPAIGPTNFVVKGDVLNQFSSFDNDAKFAFSQLDQDSYLMDIYVLARQRLEKRGVHDVYETKSCTFDDKKRFFSYRRDGGITGRMASLIWRDF